MKHILLIDDEAAIRDVLSQFLIGENYRVSTAASANAAFELAAREAPDLIISDLQLEDADGLEMIDKLHAQLPKIPVILLTGVLFDSAVVNQVLKGKVACYIEKTASLAEISEKVHRLTDTK